MDFKCVFPAIYVVHLVKHATSPRKTFRGLISSVNFSTLETAYRHATLNNTALEKYYVTFAVD